MIRWLFMLLALAVASPARADDISAAGRSVVRVVVVASEDGEVADFSHGSGFAVAPNRIVTNAHVVALANQYPDTYLIGVVPSEGDQSFTARIVAIDAARDLALLEVAGTVTPIPLYTGALDDGSNVAALGYPGNVDQATAQSAADFITPARPTRSAGNFSNERRIANVQALLHTANLARGHSGGPLVDSCGRVIGVNSFITANQDGDAPFAFAIATRELVAFLRGARQGFSAVRSECVAIADRLRQEDARRGREEADALRSRDRSERDARERALAANEDRREDYAAIALLLGTLGLVAIGGAGLMLFKDRPRTGYTLAGAGLLLLVGGVLVFLARPARSDLAVATAAATPSGPPVGGNYFCRFAEDRSRLTVSSAEDVTLGFSPSGCVNRRTQYVGGGERWTRILVPNDEATVSVAEFRPVSGEYTVTRYLLSAAEMRGVRALRSQIELKTCSADPSALALLDDRQETIRASLPRTPNERLVYRCARR